MFSVNVFMSFILKFMFIGSSVHVMWFPVPFVWSCHVVPYHVSSSDLLLSTCVLFSLVPLLTLSTLITQWTSATTCLLFTESKHMLRKNRGLNYSSLFSPHSYKTLTEMKTISIFLYMQQHISGKGNSSSVIANIVLKHQLQLRLIFSPCLLWNILKAISHSVCFSRKRNFFISCLLKSMNTIMLFY